jgi:hypothetical protein
MRCHSVDYGNGEPSAISSGPGAGEASDDSSFASELQHFIKSTLENLSVHRQSMAI